MNTVQRIEATLRDAFAPLELVVQDESERHRGHSGWREGTATHLRVHIVAESFRGKSRLERHRLINQALTKELASGVHALALHAKVPGE